jgi:hypothetical protein
LALSGFIYPAIAIGLLVAFLMLSIESYLATYTIGEFHLSHCKFSPTELRLLLAAGNVAVFHDPAVAVFKTHWRLFRFRRGNWDYRNDAYVPRLFDNSHSPALPRGTHCMSEPRANWHVEAVGI